MSRVRRAGSGDGAWLLYSKPEAPGLWRQPRRDWREPGTAARETRLTAALAPEDAENWAPADGGIYFVRRPAAGPPRLSMLDAGGSVRDVATLTPSLQVLGLDVTAEGTELILANRLPSESDLRLVSEGG